MIVFALITIITMYIFSVMFFKDTAKKNDIGGVFYMIIGFIPVINFLVAMALFTFNSNTAKRFFE